MYMWVNWRTKGSGTLGCALGRSTTKANKVIHYDLLKFSKYGYAYKFKCNSETLERFQWLAKWIIRIKLGRKINASPIWRDGRVLEYLVLWLS